MSEHKKMGRPTNDPKTKRIFIRVSEKDFSVLENYCKENKTTFSELVRSIIHSLVK